MKYIASIGFKHWINIKVESSTINSAYKKAIKMYNDGLYKENGQSDERCEEFDEIKEVRNNGKKGCK